MVVRIHVCVKPCSLARRSESGYQTKVQKQPQSSIHGIEGESGHSHTNAFPDCIRIRMLSGTGQFPHDFQPLMGQLHAGPAKTFSKKVQPLLRLLRRRFHTERQIVTGSYLRLMRQRSCVVNSAVETDRQQSAGFGVAGDDIADVIGCAQSSGSAISSPAHNAVQ